MALNQLALYTADRGVLKQNIESKFKSTKKKNVESPIGDTETSEEKLKTTSDSKKSSLKKLRKKDKIQNKGN